MAENIITLVVMAWLAFIMIVVGVFQMKCKEPVGFYTGERPLKKEQISDVPTWNKKHGIMWIAYGVGILLTYVLGMLVANEVFFDAMFLIVVIGGIPAMIVYHHWLKRKYHINR